MHDSIDQSDFLPSKSFSFPQPQHFGLANWSRSRCGRARMESLGHTHDGREKLFSLDGHQRPSGHPLRPAKTQHDDQLQVRQVFMTLNYRRVVFYCVVTLLVACCIAFFYFVFTLNSHEGSATPLSTPGQSRPPSVERSTDSMSAIPHMSTPRCAVGCANLNNTLLVCGKLTH